MPLIDFLLSSSRLLSSTKLVRLYIRMSLVWSIMKEVITLFHSSSLFQLTKKVVSSGLYLPTSTPVETREFQLPTTTFHTTLVGSVLRKVYYVKGFALLIPHTYLRIILGRNFFSLSKQSHMILLPQDSRNSQSLQ